MKTILFKCLSTLAYIAQYLFYILAAIVGFGVICFLVLREIVTNILVQIQLPYPLLIALTMLAIGILLLYGLVAKQCHLILKNLSQEDYFASDNMTSSLRLVWIFSLMLGLQFIGNSLIEYFSITNASDIFSHYSAGEYTVTIIFLIISFSAYLIFKNGRAAQEDSESII